MEDFNKQSDSLLEQREMRLFHKWVEANQRGDSKQALYIIEQGLASVSSPHGLSFFYCLQSDAYARLGHWRMAVHSCVKAIRAESDNLSAWAGLGQLLLELDKPAWALKCFQVQLNIAKSLESMLNHNEYPSATVAAYIDIAYAQHAMGKNKEAIKLLKSVLRAHPGDLMIQEAMMAMML